MKIDMEESYQDKKMINKASQEQCWKRNKEQKASVWVLGC